MHMLKNKILNLCCKNYVEMCHALNTKCLDLVIECNGFDVELCDRNNEIHVNCLHFR